MALNILTAKAELKRARAVLAACTALDESQGWNFETKRFLWCNQAVCDAEKSVPWWLDSPREIRDRFRDRHED